MSVDSELKKFYYTDFLKDLKSILSSGKPKIPNYLTKATEDIMVRRINSTLEAHMRLNFTLTKEEIEDFNKTIDELGEAYGGFLKIGVDTLKLEVQE